VAGDSFEELAWHILFVFSLFACVGLHELGHALTAKRYGIKTKSITFFPIGGVARLSRMPKEPVQELTITIAGPLVNLAIAILLFVGLGLSGNASFGMENLEQYSTINAENFLFMLFISNIVLFLFNLIPAFPMDGGRILRALIAMKTSYRTATQMAVTVGQVFAIMFVFVGLIINPFLIIIAMFIFISAQSELMYAIFSESLSNSTAKDVMMRKLTTFSIDDSLEAAATEIINGQDKIFLVKDEIGTSGYFTKNDIIKGLSFIGKKAPIKHIMRSDPKWVKNKTSASEIWDIMMQENEAIIFVGEKRRLDGVINFENLKEWVSLNNSDLKFQKNEEAFFNKEFAYK